MSWKKNAILALVTFGSGSSVVYALRRQKLYASSDIELTNVSQNHSNKWERNWDRREVLALVNPNKCSALQNTDEDKENKLNNLIKNNSSSATRRLIFIRHGQYDLNGKTDDEKILTDLGIKQATATGKRLKDLNLNVTRIVQSSMMRAKETCYLINQFFPEVSVETSDLLREGAPIPPIPTHRSWEPEVPYNMSHSIAHK